MAQLTTAAQLVAGLAGLAVLLAGCGTSVADADRVAPTTHRSAPLSPFCAAAQASTAALAPLSALTQRGPVPADQLAPAADAVRRSNAELVTTAPPELLADVRRTVDVVSAQLDALVRDHGDGSAAAGDPTVQAAVGDRNAVAAAQRVTAYLARTCPIG